jgi:hypothetical protein
MESLDAKDYVAQIAYALEDPLFSNWFQTSQEYYESLSFANFMSKVCICWLPPGWEKEFIVVIVVLVQIMKLE